MKRYFIYASLLIALAAARGLAQTPGLPSFNDVSPSDRADPFSEVNSDAAPAAPGANEPDDGAAQVRRQLAAPLRNQFDAYRRPQQFEDLKADVVTPEMWLYMQEMRRYDDPLQAVRRNAATRAAHRRSRLAAMQWFGFSNTRPQANPMPFMDIYSPGWISNSWNPYAWIGSGHAWTAVRAEPIIITR